MPSSAVSVPTLPTYEVDPRFARDFARLGTTEARAFVRAKNRFVAALKANRAPDPGLGIQQLTGHPGKYEFHFSDTGRATFEYGSTARGREAHVRWRRIGGHVIYTNP